jgi:NADPH:quinone reductase-like Zn-dependent oxidoreductase
MIASRIDSRPASRCTPPSGFVLAAAFVLVSFAEISFSATPATPSAPSRTAVVASAVQDLFTRPDETSPVDDQVILGERVEILEDAAGFARVRTAAGEIAWIPERALRRLPATLDFVDGALVEPLSIALHVLNRAQFSAGQSLAVVGSGTIGTCAMQVARHRGATKFFAVDRIDERVALGLRMGADFGVNNTRKDPVAAGLEFSPKGYDVVLELVGEDWTLSIYEASNYGIFLGDASRAKINCGVVSYIHRRRRGKGICIWNYGFCCLGTAAVVRAGV